eukprot:gene23687-biopygen17845
MLPPDYFSPKNGEGHTTRQNIRNPATTTTASVAPTTRGRGRCDGRRVNSLPLEHPPGRHGCGSVPPLQTRFPPWTQERERVPACISE